MNWQQVCEHPSLQNIPFKIELNERGQILMSPVKVIHSLLQGQVDYLLRQCLENGKSFPECAVKTRRGTKVADVVWASDERLQQIKYETECSVAPEICIEIVSESNTAEEMDEKRLLYLENGAEEVWMCTSDGDMSFYNEKGRIAKSVLAPDFSEKIDI